LAFNTHGELHTRKTAIINDRGGSSPHSYTPTEAKKTRT
jgi:hypothetical protein